jgi:hypothetical protein
MNTMPAVEVLAENAVETLLAGYRLDPRKALLVLRRVGEKISPHANDAAAALEQLHVRSLGVEQEMLGEEGGAVSDAELARMLGLKARQSVHNYRDSGKIFGVPKGTRNYLYPAWQVHKGQVLRGLGDVLAVLQSKRTTPLGVVNFFLTEAEALDGVRPLDLLRKGETAEVVAHAERYGSIGS